MENNVNNIEVEVIAMKTYIHLVKIKRRIDMLINKTANTETNVKFISYTGCYPNLCRGVLTLEIDDVEYKFGHDSNVYRSWETDGNFDKFWFSGGGLDSNYYTYKGEWEIDVKLIPEQFRKYAAEIDEVFNSNVPFGCCGGCA